MSRKKDDSSPTGGIPTHPAAERGCLGSLIFRKAMPSPGQPQQGLSAVGKSANSLINIIESANWRVPGAKQPLRLTHHRKDMSLTVTLLRLVSIWARSVAQAMFSSNSSRLYGHYGNQFFDGADGISGHWRLINPQKTQRHQRLSHRRLQHPGLDHRAVLGGHQQLGLHVYRSGGLHLGGRCFCLLGGAGLAIW